MELATSGLLLIRDRKLLLAYSLNKKCFYLPGGKIDPAETAEEALYREITEELNIDLVPGELHYYTHITAPAFGETDGTIMEQDCFLADGRHEPIPSGEIGELRYFSLAEYLDEPVTAPGAILVLEKLKSDGLID